MRTRPDTITRGLPQSLADACPRPETMPLPVLAECHSTLSWLNQSIAKWAFGAYQPRTAIT